MTGLGDYELLDLLNEYINAAAFHFMNFLALYFAFLFASYTVGKELNRTMLIIIIGLYTAFTILPATASFFDLRIAHSIATELVRRDAISGFSLQYKTGIFAGQTGFFIMVLSPFLQVSAYFAGLVFLSEVRKRDGRGNAA
jgi:hypothetical protein